MVKVLENRVVDLDIFPGTKEEQEAAAKARYLNFFVLLHTLIISSHCSRQVATGVIPNEDAQNATLGQNVQNAGMAIGGALGGAVKGLLDTAGNTVGTLGEGVAGTLGGVGKGLVDAAVYGGSALDEAGRSVGGALGFGGTKGKETQNVNERTTDVNKKGL
jgi:hypothetical protein